jgi:hypothetical protein
MAIFSAKIARSRLTARFATLFWALGDRVRHVHSDIIKDVSYGGQLEIVVSVGVCGATVTQVAQRHLRDGFVRIHCDRRDGTDHRRFWCRSFKGRLAGGRLCAGNIGWRAADDPCKPQSVCPHDCGLKKRRACLAVIGLCDSAGLWLADRLPGTCRRAAWRFLYSDHRDPADAVRSKARTSSTGADVFGADRGNGTGGTFGHGAGGFLRLASALCGDCDLFRNRRDPAAFRPASGFRGCAVAVCASSAQGAGAGRPSAALCFHCLWFWWRVCRFHLCRGLASGYRGP